MTGAHTYFLRLFTLVTKAHVLASIVVFTAYGSDYLMGDYHTSGIVEITNSINPLVWGATCVATALILTYGLARTSWRAITVGSVIGAVAAFLFFCTAMWGVITRTPWDDWRFTWVHAFVCASCCITAYSSVILRDIQKDQGGADGGLD